MTEILFLSPLERGERWGTVWLIGCWRIGIYLELGIWILGFKFLDYKLKR
jgi:hypothetical protein